MSPVYRWLNDILHKICCHLPGRVLLAGEYHFTQRHAARCGSVCGMCPESVTMPGRVRLLCLALQIFLIPVPSQTKTSSVFWLRSYFFAFRFWLRGYLRMAVMHHPTKYGASILIQLELLTFSEIQ